MPSVDVAKIMTVVISKYVSHAVVNSMCLNDLQKGYPEKIFNSTVIIYLCSSISIAES